MVGPRVFIIEARYSQGVTMRILSEAMPCDWIATGCNWSEPVETSALGKLQTRYSILAAIAVGLGLRPPGQSEICSLFAAEAIAPGLPGFVVDRDGMTPGHLAELFLAAGGVLRTLN